MNPSQQKVLILSLILCGVIRLTDSFGQHSRRTSTVYPHYLTQLNSSKVQGQSQRKRNGRRMNEFGILNKKILEQESAQDILGVLTSTKGALTTIAGGGKMSTVNFSTSIHRIARHLTQYTSKDKPGNDRAAILRDPRFALLMCSTAEALLDGAEKADYHYKRASMGRQSEDGRNYFKGRELANIAWGIAKINVAPPDSVVEVDIGNAATLLRKQSKIVRSAVLEVAKQKKSGSPSSPSAWIPALSELCGLIIDACSSNALTLNPANFQQQELSNMMWALATAQRPNQDVFEFVIKSILASAEARKSRINANSQHPNNVRHVNKEKELIPQEWSIPLWVLAKTGTDLGHEEQLLPFVNDMMENEPGFLERFKPQELSNSVWAAATIISKRQQRPRGAASEAALGILRHTSKQLIERNGERYKTQELANHAWAMATLGFGMAVDQATIAAENCQLTHSYTHLVSDDLDGDKQLVYGVMKIIIERIKKNIWQFSSQELNNCCWAMARLDVQDLTVMKMILEELANPRKFVGSQDLSTTLWAMANMEHFEDKDLYRGVVARFRGVGSDNFKPQEISNTLWALATLGVTPKYTTVFDDVLLPSKVRPSMEEAMSDPVTAMFGAGATEFSRRPNDFKTQEIKDLLWAFTRAGVRHPKLFRAAAEHLVGEGDRIETTGRGMNEFNSQGIANLAYSYARHSQLGEETMNKYKHLCSLPFTGGKLAVYTIVYLDVGEGLLRKLFAEIARADLEVHDNLSKLTSQDISNTCWAMGVVGLKHQTFLRAAEKEIRSRMKAFVLGRRNSSYILGQEVGNILWAFATLDYTPSGFLDLVEAYLVKRLGNDLRVSKSAEYMSRQELANMAWATAVFGEYPETFVGLLYNGILGVSEGLDPKYMQMELYKDEGIQPTHFNSLLYLQMMMDLDLGVDQNKFSLPENFPAEWTSNPAQRFSRDSSSSSNSDTDSIMEVSTSAVQTRVSRAFDRIDFGHVDEYLLTMKDLVDEFGIQMAPLPIEILSLDIANIDARIGVEVDGPGHWITNIDPASNKDILSDVGSYRIWQTKNGEPSFEYTFNWNTENQVINGSTSLKWRLFEKIGWKIISLPFWDWFPIDNVNKKANEVKLFEAQDDFCRGLLEGK